MSAATIITSAQWLHDQAAQQSATEGRIDLVFFLLCLPVVLFIFGAVVWSLRDMAASNERMAALDRKQSGNTNG